MEENKRISGIVRSECIKNLAIALAKFNAKVNSIPKDAKNPFFKSEYVTLDSLIIATRGILQENGLSVLQFPVDKDGMVGVQTLLVHESGEYIEGLPFYLKPAKCDPQAYGSAITYARRYSYQAILNLNCGEDDDGNSATFGDNKPKQFKQGLTEAQVKRLYAIGNKAKQTPASILAVCIKEYGVKRVEDLSKEHYDAICERLEKAGAK